PALRLPTETLAASVLAPDHSLPIAPSKARPAPVQRFPAQDCRHSCAARAPRKTIGTPVAKRPRTMVEAEHGGSAERTAPLARVCVWLLVPNNGAPDASDITVRGNRTPPLRPSLAIGAACVFAATFNASDLLQFSDFPLENGHLLAQLACYARAQIRSAAG